MNISIIITKTLADCHRVSLEIRQGFKSLLYGRYILLLCVACMNAFVRAHARGHVGMQACVVKIEVDIRCLRSYPLSYFLETETH